MPVSIRRAAEAIRDLFEEHMWPYEYKEDMHLFSTRFDLEVPGLDHTDIRILPRPSAKDPAKCRTIAAYAFIPLKVAPARIAEVCEYLTRANFGLAIGNFELDYDHGVIRYKITLNCRSGIPGISALEDLVSIPVAMYNRYGSGLLAVNDGTATAAEAAKKADTP